MKRLTERIVTFDVETTTKNKGHPYTLSNKLVTIQLKVNDEPTQVFFEEQFGNVLGILRSATCLVATNSKFDLSWLRRELGFVATTVWDLQIAEFLFSNQLWIYPDLHTMAENYGVGHKTDVVKTEYWDKDIDTDQIPRDILAEYGANDVDVSYAVFKKQLDKFQNSHEHMFRLFRVQCNDLLVLQEMEWNGILYDAVGSLEQADNLNLQVEKIDAQLNQLSGGLILNYNSRDDVSTLLYGGIIDVVTRIPIGEYKSGAKTGEVRYKNVTQSYQLPRLVEPLKGSALKKEGYYSTDADTLVSLKPDKLARRIIKLLLERAKIKKLQSTYLTGFPKTIGVMEWENNVIHSNLNQCAVVSGRLSSTKPNTQNLPKESKRFCLSRY